MNKIMTAEEILLENGYENVMTFGRSDCDDALIGVSNDDRAIYDYDLMIESLMSHDDMTYEEAIDWVDGIIRFIPVMGNKSPIIMYRLER